MYQNMVKSGLICGGHIRPGPDTAGYENMAGFRPGPGPGMISGATLVQMMLDTGKQAGASSLKCRMLNCIIGSSCPKRAVCEI